MPERVGANVQERKACVQECYAPENRCFGCGPANDQGLRLRSFEAGAEGKEDVLVAEWRPEPHHQAFVGVLNGGIIGALLDCHSNWTAACALMRRDGLEQPPPTVTVDFHIKLRRPTPTAGPVFLEAWPVETKGSKVTVEATLTAGGKVTATCSGHFMAVKPDHPAYEQR